MLLPVIANSAQRTLLQSLGWDGPWLPTAMCLLSLSSFYSFVQFPCWYRTPASGSALEQVLSVQYSVVTPLLNPLIYSLKNQEVKAALREDVGQKPRLTF